MIFIVFFAIFDQNRLATFAPGPPADAPGTSATFASRLALGQLSALSALAIPKVLNAGFKWVLKMGITMEDT